MPHHHFPNEGGVAVHLRPNGPDQTRAYRQTFGRDAQDGRQTVYRAGRRWGDPGCQFLFYLENRVGRKQAALRYHHYQSGNRVDHHPAAHSPERRLPDGSHLGGRYSSSRRSGGRCRPVGYRGGRHRAVIRLPTGVPGDQSPVFD